MTITRVAHLADIVLDTSSELEFDPKKKEQ
jgi:hypothetical protein